MVDSSQVIDQAIEILAKNLNINDYKLNLQPSTSEQNGFTGELRFGTLEDRTNGNSIDLVIKKGHHKDDPQMSKFINAFFETEFSFYEKIIPALENIQTTSKDVSKNVCKFPKCLLVLKKPSLIVILENIAPQGYKMYKTDEPLPPDHLRLTFSRYGQFHALSFALKAKQPEVFAALEKTLADPFKGIERTSMGIEEGIEAIGNLYLKKGNKVMQEKVMNVLNRYEDILFKRYYGKYSCITHGDCWSNNVLFKYNKIDDEEKVEDICLLDFQLAKVNSPVFDLAYFLYTSGVKEDFKQLDQYLEIYHNSLSKCLKDLGCDPNEVFPFEAFKNDWKGYAVFGFVISFMVLKIKLTKNDNLKEVFEETDFSKDMFDKFHYDTDLFNQRICDIADHLAEIGAI